MIKINLVPPEILQRERQRQRAIQAIFVAGCAMAIVLTLTLWHLRQGSKAASELAAVQKEYKEKWADIGAKLDKRKADVEALRTRLGVITDLLKGRALYPHFMADVGRVMPGDAWVTQISTSRDSGKNQLKVTMMAATGSANSIPTWLRTLSKPATFGSFTEPTITPISISEDQETNGKKYEFTLTTSYVPRL